MFLWEQANGALSCTHHSFASHFLASSTWQLAPEFLHDADAVLELLRHSSIQQHGLGLITQLVLSQAEQKNGCVGVRPMHLR
jgi:hypothetical protein